jgi:hypothetical protein
LFRLYVAKEFGGRFGQNRIDKHARSQLEAGDAREPWNHADVPVEMPGAAVVGRRAPDGEIKVGILESDVKLG